MWHTLEGLGETAFFAQFPYLNWYPLNALLKWFFEQKSDQTYDYAAMLLNLAYVPMKNSSTQEIAQETQLAVKEALDKFGINSPEAQDARKKNQIAFANHVRSLLVPGGVRGPENPSA